MLLYVCMTTQQLGYVRCARIRTYDPCVCLLAEARSSPNLAVGAGSYIKWLPRPAPPFSVNIKFNSLSQRALYGAVIASIIHLVLSGGATRWSLTLALAANPPQLTSTGCLKSVNTRRVFADNEVIAWLFRKKLILLRLVSVLFDMWISWRGCQHEPHVVKNRVWRWGTVAIR